MNETDRGPRFRLCSTGHASSPEWPDGRSQTLANPVRRVAVGEGIEAGSEDDVLVHASREGLRQLVFGEAAAGGDEARSEGSR